MRFAVITVVSLFICLIHTHAQTVSIGAFLATAEKDVSVGAQKEKVEFLEGSSKNMPVIDDIEVRIRNEAYQFDEQRYSLRVEPRGIGETKAGRDLYRTRTGYNRQRKELLITRALKDRYSLVVELLAKECMLQLQKELVVLYEDKLKVLEQKSGDLKFDLTDLIRVENKLTRFKFENIERERSVNRLKKEIGGYLSREDFTAFDTAGFVTVKSISEWIEKNNFSLDTNNVYLKYDRLNFQLAENRLNLETAEGRRYISFFEFGYDHGRMKEELDEKTPERNEAFIMNLGIRIPYINTDRHDINRRKLTYLSDKEDYLELKRELKERMEKDVGDIKVLVSQYSFLDARGSDVNAESSLKRYMEMEGVDPLILLEIRESIIENDIQKEKIKFDILRNYIRVIDVTGQLSQKPHRNYLSLKQEVITK